MDTLNNNSILFLGLANEYCNAIENAASTEKEDFINHMIKLLPRIYISATDLTFPMEAESSYSEGYLDEIYYDSVRRNLEMLLGEDDTFLEVFMEDMKFSDTPIASSIAECLSDIFQCLYDLIHAVKDIPQEHMNEFLLICKENFDSYWGQTLCNVLRALHNVKYNYGL